jgi:hypothetical protein
MLLPAAFSNLVCLNTGAQALPLSPLRQRAKGQQGYERFEHDGCAHGHREEHREPAGWVHPIDNCLLGRLLCWVLGTVSSQTSTGKLTLTRGTPPLASGPAQDQGYQRHNSVNQEGLVV